MYFFSGCICLLDFWATICSANFRRSDEDSMLEREPEPQPEPEPALEPEPEPGPSAANIGASDSAAD